VFADADLDAVAGAAAMAATYNSGQDCTAATRVYVESGVHDALIDALAARMESIVVGDPLDPGTDIGPLITAEHRQRVDGFVQRAGAVGGRVVAARRRPRAAPTGG
jgi:betaine-aldehyde dehydrogenase